MTRVQFRKFMSQAFQANVLSLYDEGNKEYAKDDNAFANFEGLSKETGTSPAFCLWILFLKHKDGVSAWIKGHRSQREAVEGRIYDMIVYLFLLLGIIEEDSNEKRNTVVSSRSLEGKFPDSPSGTIQGGSPKGYSGTTLNSRERVPAVQTEPT